MDYIYLSTGEKEIVLVLFRFFAFYVHCKPAVTTLQIFEVFFAVQTRI